MPDEWQATPFGLWSMTTGLWASEGFCDLTVPEASALLGEHLGTYPTTIQEMVGGFPSEDDCAIALEQSTRAQTLQKMLALQEARIARLEIVQLERQIRGVDGTTPDAAANLAALRASRDATALELMGALDQAMPSVRWSLIHRLYLRWARGEKGSTPSR